jgi:hypothetical protein
MSTTVIAIIIGALAIVVAAVIVGFRWIRPNGDVNRRRLVAVSIVACLLLAAASVAGAVGGSPWFILYGVVGIPLLALITYRQIAQNDT